MATLSEEQDAVMKSEENDYTSDVLEEIEALEAIYVEELEIDRDKCGRPKTIQVKLYPSTAERKEEQYVKVHLGITLPKQYPNEVPQLALRFPRGLADEHVQSLHKDIMQLANSRRGGPMMYELIEYVKESLTHANTPYGECCICLCRFSGEGEVRDYTRTDCYHYFHYGCLYDYIQHSLKQADIRIQELRERHALLPDNDSPNEVVCPVCRVPIMYELHTLEKHKSIAGQAVESQDDLEWRDLHSEKYQEEQRERLALFEKQKKKGAIINLQEEKDRFLIGREETVQVPPVVSSWSAHGYDPNEPQSDVIGGTTQHKKKSYKGELRQKRSPPPSDDKCKSGKPDRHKDEYKQNSSWRKYNGDDQGYRRSSDKHNYDGYHPKHDSITHKYDGQKQQYDGQKQRYDVQKQRYDVPKQRLDRTSPKYDEKKQRSDKTCLKYDEQKQGYDKTSPKYNEQKSLYDRHKHNSTSPQYGSEHNRYRNDQHIEDRRDAGYNNRYDERHSGRYRKQNNRPGGSGHDNNNRKFTTDTRVNSGKSKDIRSDFTAATDTNRCDTGVSGSGGSTRAYYTAGYTAKKTVDATSQRKFGIRKTDCEQPSKCEQPRAIPASTADSAPSDARPKGRGRGRGRGRARLVAQQSSGESSVGGLAQTATDCHMSMTSVQYELDNVSSAFR